MDCRYVMASGFTSKFAPTVEVASSGTVTRGMAPASRAENGSLMAQNVSRRCGPAPCAAPVCPHPPSEGRPAAIGRFRDALVTLTCLPVVSTARATAARRPPLWSGLCNPSIGRFAVSSGVGPAWGPAPPLPHETPLCPSFAAAETLYPPRPHGVEPDRTLDPRFRRLLQG